MKYILRIFAVLLFPFSINGQQITKSEQGTFLLKGATIVTITQGNKNEDLLVKDGIIAAMGVNLSQDGATVLDCSGQYIYPGMIDAGCNLGLSEVGSVSLTQDFRELGSFRPQMQALTAVNPNGVAIPVTRVSGVTSVFTKPSGGRFPGTGALINLHGYTPEQMYAGFKGVVMNFPSSGRRGQWDRRTDEELKKEKEKAETELKDIWTKAKLYAKIDSASNANKKSNLEYNPGLSSLVDIVNGKASLLVEANKAADIKAALKWLKANNVKAVITGASEGWRVTKELKESGFPVITGPVLNRPGRSSDRYDKPYANAGLMQKAGIKVAIRTNETENVRNLPYNAGFAAAYGMGTDEALKAVTIVPAEIFGVADKYGSIEIGKMASLFISDGDPFETSTDIKHLFINGWKIPLESRHTHLYDEFLERSPGLIPKK